MNDVVVLLVVFGLLIWLGQALARSMRPKPCARCGVEGGYRFAQGERIMVEGRERIVHRSVCDDCHSAIFFGHHSELDEGRDWCGA